jgi:hypothetical protein
MCDESRHAGTILMPIRKLKKMKLEHSENWNVKKLMAIYGDPVPHGFEEGDKK